MYKAVIFDMDGVIINSVEGTAVPGVINLIHRLKTEGKLLAVASSAGRRFIDAVLKKLELTQYFDAIVSADDVEHSKPDPEIFQKAVEALGVTPGDCIVIEDSCNGVAAAKAAGIWCVGFRNPSSGNQDLSKADLIVKNFAEIE